MKKSAPELPDMLTSREAAAVLKVHHQTLAKWRWRGVGPDYFYLGSRVRYSKKELAAWVAANSRHPIAICA
jgi:excisionase family DNA binding protein